MNNDGKLTPEQLKNWRESVLPIMFGGFASFMTDEQIQKTRDAIQSKIEEERK